MTGSEWGSPEQASEYTEGRHPGTRNALQWLCFSHLPAALRPFAAPFFNAAIGIIGEVKVDSPELTTSLNTLIAAKDHAVRAGVRAVQGHAGPHPRPATIVDPPQLNAGS